MRRGTPGPGVDADRGTSVDPTKNVLDLVHASERRLDDLREAESRAVREIMAMDRQYQAELRVAESARVDANRAVDNAASTRAAEVQAAAAQALAAVVATTSETLRAQDANTATTLAAALVTALDPIKTAIADLQRTQYETAGGKASTREGAGDRRASTGTVVAVGGLALALLALTVTILLAALGR